MVGDDAPTPTPTPSRRNDGCCSRVKGVVQSVCSLRFKFPTKWLRSVHSRKKEKNGGDHVDCNIASFVDGGEGQTQTMIQCQCQCQCQCRRPWSDLPNDLLFSIASRLGRVDDFIRFMNVCKGWLDSIEPHGGHVNRIMPCLLAMENPDLGRLSLYTPFPNSKTIKLRIPELKESEFRFCKDGWILLSKSIIDSIMRPYLFLFNLSTGAKFDLPHLNIPTYFGGVCFTSTPGNSDFMVFAIDAMFSRSIVIFTYRPSTDQQTWTMIDCDENNHSGTSTTTTTMDVRFRGVSCNPVFYKGELYCLDNYGQLGAFDPIQKKNWRIVTDKPNNFDDWRKTCDLDMEFPLDSPRSFPYKSFLMVDLKGDLISVFVYEWKTPKDVHIFRLDDSRMGWEKVNSLDSTGGHLFVGLSTSTATISTVQVPHDEHDHDHGGSSCNSNQLIYFPGFKANHFSNNTNNNKGKKAWMYNYESYSLKTKEYDKPSRSCLWRDPLKFTGIEFPMSKWESIFYSKWESICYSKCKS